MSAQLQHFARQLVQLITQGRAAEFSADKVHRYLLTRDIGPEKRTACFVMLNPSTADEFYDDATIRRCIGYARTWSCGGLIVANLFAFRATDPRYITVVRDPIGPENDLWVGMAARSAQLSGGSVIAAWGVRGAHGDRDRHVMKLLTQTLGIAVTCLGTTVEGFPRHPLYLTRETALQPYAGRPLNED